MYDGCITDVEGIIAGHYTDAAAQTGCTIVIAQEGAVGGVDVRGGAPGTRETDAFSEQGAVPLMNAVMLSGGSAFGLASADGAMAWLEQQGMGYDTGFAKVPLVGGAVIYDLSVGDAKTRPGFEAGYQAAAAAAGDKLQQGSVGAGTGATVAKMAGFDKALKGGIGSASMKLGDTTLAALVCVNAVGNIYDHNTGQMIAGQDMNAVMAAMAAAAQGVAMPGTNTTIGVIATDAALDKQQAKRLAMLAHDGMAMCIRPVHTTADGDTAFALATGKTGCSFDMLCGFASEVFARAIINAIESSR